MPDRGRRLQGSGLRAVAAQLARIGRHARRAWPVFPVFLAQRLLTVAFLQHAGGLDGLTARWDAGWYRRLAQGGYVYPNLLADGRPRGSNLAYFPLYPWLSRQVADTGLSLDHALLVVSWLGGLAAVWAIFAVGDALYGRGPGLALAALWGTAPASLALTMGYPEGMFTAAAAATLFCLVRRRPVWAGLCAVAAGLLRPSAVAVVAMVGAYLVVELVRWLARFRTGGDRAFPVRALVGAALSTLGLGAFMVYVARRTGETFGYFTVQAQWGQSTAGLADYVSGTRDGLFGTGTGAGTGAEAGPLVALTVAVGLGYLVLFFLVAFDRELVWGTVYAAVLLVLALSHVTFQHVYARQLLPAFVLLVPFVRMRVPRAGAVAALVVVSVVMSWASATFLLHPSAGM